MTEFSVLMPLGWLVWASLAGLAFAFARRPGAGSMRVATGLAATWALVVLAVALVGGGDRGLDGGLVMLGGRWLGDATALGFDGLAALVAFVGLGRVARQDGGREASASLRTLITASLGALGVALVVHASDVFGAWLGLELAAICAWWARRRGTMDRHQRARASSRDALALVLGALGICLIFGATADLSFEGLAGRVAKVFNHWGGVQRFVYTLRDAGEALPEGFVVQAKGRIVTGMAGVSLLLPGVLSLSAAVLLRLFEVGGMRGAGLFVRLAAVAATLRIFVTTLHAPRLVNEPYGWAGPIIAIALVWAGWSLWRAARARSVSGLARALAQMQLGLIVVTLVAAANFYGHRALADRPVAPRMELRWAQFVGDEAVAAALHALLSTWAACSALAWLTRAWTRERIPLADLEGIVRSRPGWALAAMALLAWLAGAPLTPGFSAMVHTLHALMAHSELRWVLVACALGWFAALAIVARVVWMAFDDEEREGVPELPPLRARGRVALVLGLVVLGTLWPRLPMQRARVAASGLSYGIVSERRAEWVGEMRQGAGLTGLESGPKSGP